MFCVLRMRCDSGYMAFHLKMSDLERARQVAERAVKHVTWTAATAGPNRSSASAMLPLFGASDFEVGFSDSKERFNVWVAYMNLECTFGTEKTADAVFSRASSHNDAKQVGKRQAMGRLECIAAGCVS